MVNAVSFALDSLDGAELRDWLIAEEPVHSLVTNGDVGLNGAEIKRNSTFPPRSLLPLWQGYASETIHFR